jgi:hypothetical protein
LSHKQEIWIGGLFDPYGFLTATRQAVSRKLSLPLENMEISLSFDEEADTEQLPFCINGISSNY